MTEEKKIKNTILDEAKGLVYGDGEKSYGSPLEDFNRTALMWGAIIGAKVTAKQVGLCMVALKISRECHSEKRDNLVDGAGYFATIEKLIDAQNIPLSECVLGFIADKRGET